MKPEGPRNSPVTSKSISLGTASALVATDLVAAHHLAIPPTHLSARPWLVDWRQRGNWVNAQGGVILYGQT